jgi:hypothetical protein
MLHITNGDAAVPGIRASGVEGPVLVWLEVLHEGPVPAGLTLHELSAVRSRFFSDLGWDDDEPASGRMAERDRMLMTAGSEDEVVLWFEHDLYDQLQLIQLLDWFADHPPAVLSLVNPAEYLGLATPTRLAGLFAVREPVTAGQLDLGRRAWAAFRSATPEEMARMLGEDTSALPFLHSAFQRLLEQLPGADDGLSRSERQVVEALADQDRTAGELFQMHNALEDPIWLGDAPFVDYLRSLASEPTPLVSTPAGAEALSEDAWHRQPVSLTPAGQQVLGGRADAVGLRGVDRWLGGTHLVGEGPVWRWDRVAGRVTRR